MSKGPQGQKRPADLNKRAFSVVQIASGEATEALPSPGPAKAGKAGGPARANSLTAAQRKAIAEKAAKARWKR
jgi:hypothetical protein